MLDRFVIPISLVAGGFKVCLAYNIGIQPTGAAGIPYWFSLILVHS